MEKTRQLILASGSPRRISALKKEKLPFRIIPSGIEEKTTLKKPFFIVRDLARQKTINVAIKNPDNPVLGFDTLVYCRGKILGKPKNKKDALRLLKLQNGRWQKVYTGVSLIWLSRKINLSKTEISACLARKLSETELLSLAGKHMDKAGAYAVQNDEDFFIKKIKGRFDNVVGIPMNIVRTFLKKIKYI